MLEVPSNSEPGVDDLASFVDSFRRPKDVPNTRGWLPGDGHVAEEHLRELGAVVRDYERPSSASFFRFRRPGCSLLLCGASPGDEAAVIDRLAKDLDLRIFTYDMRDVRRLVTPDMEETLAPLYDGRSVIVHLRRVDTIESAELEDVLARRSRSALVVATVPNDLNLDPAMTRQFKRRLTF
jgi:hypothetical protein